MACILYSGKKMKRKAHGHEWKEKLHRKAKRNLREEDKEEINEERRSWVQSHGGKKYFYVSVDIFSQYTWVEFIREKSDTFDVFKKLIVQLQKEKEQHVVRIKEFENSKFSKFCANEGNTQEFSAPLLHLNKMGS
ncbi:hypothetical protein LIER_19467 [Lithospermum erythrorhizon]|uniref:Integrase catalytic domain-containing protein n=1 Tax=Lithospermum erythrorhizon TaxID=34254 RepID=A0AAV3QHW4_LITER